MSGGGRLHDVGSYAITLGPIGDTVVCRRDETVLSAILRSGAKVAFGCRGGGCGTCKMRLISGNVERGRCSAAVLLREEEENGSFLSCQAQAVTDLTVELTGANKYRGPMAAWRWLGGSDS